LFFWFVIPEGNLRLLLSVLPPPQTCHPEEFRTTTTLNTFHPHSPTPNLSQTKATPPPHIRISPNMKRLIITTISLVALCGCNQNAKTPDQIRQDAQNATNQATKVAAVATEDAKAAVQGVQDGLNLGHPININTAARDSIASLPGVTGTTADKIIEGRPYTSTSDLVGRHIVTGTEYDRISNRITAN
jgi:DNA uptake protein ComE-like DNA-binding protein